MPGQCTCLAVTCSCSTICLVLLLYSFLFSFLGEGSVFHVRMCALGLSPATRIRPWEGPSVHLAATGESAGVEVRL